MTWTNQAARHPIMNVLNKKQPNAPRDTELAARRRDEILERAAAFFSEYGYPNADMQSLANELGVGKGTLYRYFASKEELFFAAADRGMRLLHEYVEANRNHGADPIQQIENAIRMFFRFFDQHPQYLELLIQERSEFRNRREPTYLKHCDANSRSWDPLTETLYKSGRLRKLPDKQFESTINNLLYGTLFTNYFARKHMTFEEQTNDIVEVILCGVLSESEQKRFLGDR
jgi:AcrR family transcriptional regulator